MKAKMKVLYDEGRWDKDPEWNLIRVVVRLWSQPERRDRDAIMEFVVVHDGDTVVSDRKVLPAHMTTSELIRTGVAKFDELLFNAVALWKSDIPEDNNSLGSGSC